MDSRPAAGQANALRALLRSEMERSADFLRLANALAALYPKDTEERRLVEAMLLAVPPVTHPPQENPTTRVVMTPTAIPCSRRVD